MWLCALVRPVLAAIDGTGWGSDFDLALNGCIETFGSNSVSQHLRAGGTLVYHA